VGAGRAAELDRRRTDPSGTAVDEQALTARLLERHVLALFDSGALRVPVAETFPLERAPEAYDRFRAGGKLGKIVLTT
jgi:NADPH:quinone reductase-like Zn-dependent oxidoreductase